MSMMCVCSAARRSDGGAGRENCAAAAGRGQRVRPDGGRALRGEITASAARAVHMTPCSMGAPAA